MQNILAISPSLITLFTSSHVCIHIILCSFKQLKIENGEVWFTKCIISRMQIYGDHRVNWIILNKGMHWTI